MVQYRVRTESLGEVANLLQSVVSTFDAQVAETDSVVRSVVDSSWQGEDATVFDTQWNEFQAGATALRAVLSSLATRLQAAEGGYGATEAGLGSGFADSEGALAVRPAASPTAGLGAPSSSDPSSGAGTEQAGDAS
jgi:WXG100 family type VII secretion target